MAHRRGPVDNLAVVVAAVAAAVAAVALAAAPALAGAAIDRAAEELRRDPVFVDPAAPANRSITGDQAENLRELIREGDAPIFVAVLGQDALDEVAGDQNQLVREIGDKVGLAGTYAVVTPQGFRAGSNVDVQAAAIASSAFQAQRANGASAVLREFVTRIQARAGDAASPSEPLPRVVVDPAATEPDTGGGGVGVFGIVFLVALVAGGIWLFRRAGRKRAEAERDEESHRQMLRAELSVLGDDVMSLDPQVAIHPEAKDDYDAAVSRFRAAEAALDYADDPVDLVRVERVVAEARYAMARARARIDGREPPPPPEELARPGPRNEPPVELDDDNRPVYRGGGGWYGGGGGWWGGGGGGGGGLLEGLLLGSILTGGWGGGGRAEEHHHGHDSGNDDDRSSGWGGGDSDGGFGSFGGGDWGGSDSGDIGDVGGGDW